MDLLQPPESLTCRRAFGVQSEGSTSQDNLGFPGYGASGHVDLTDGGNIESYSRLQQIMHYNSISPKRDGMTMQIFTLPERESP